MAAPRPRPAVGDYVYLELPAAWHPADLAVEVVAVVGRHLVTVRFSTGGTLNVPHRLTRKAPHP